MQQHKRTSFLGLPPEFHTNIYKNVLEDFLHEDVWTVFHLYNNLYNKLPGSNGTLGSCENRVSIVRTCRLVYREAIEVLYSQVEIVVRIMDLKKSDYVPRRTPIGPPSGQENGHTVQRRISRFARAINYGEHLSKLRIIFNTPEDEGLPAYFDDVVQAMMVFRVNGQVDVEINPDAGDGEVTDLDCDDLCELLEDFIRGEESMSTLEA